MKVSEVYAGNWLRNEDLGDDDYAVTISEVEKVDMNKDDEGKPDERIAIKFEEFDKQLVLNKTNAQTIAALYGDETDDWVGERVTLFVTDVEYKGKMTPAIRVRSRAPKPKRRRRATKSSDSKSAKRSTKRTRSRRRDDDEEYDDE